MGDYKDFTSFQEITHLLKLHIAAMLAVNPSISIHSFVFFTVCIWDAGVRPIRTGNYVGINLFLCVGIIPSNGKTFLNLYTN